MQYDLEERCEKFGENIIDLCKELKSIYFVKPLMNQIMRSATSIGANYMEANQASSKRDFLNKVRTCQKEANETKHWLRMIAKALPGKKELCVKNWKETHELTLIFAKISKTCRNKN